MGTDKNRERKVIAAVGCPSCDAPRGTVCRLQTATERAMAAAGRLLVHKARREAWQAWKTAHPVDIQLVGSRLVARSLDVYREIDVRAPESAERYPDELAVWVPERAVLALILELTEAGWRIE